MSKIDQKITHQAKFVRIGILFLFSLGMCLFVGLVLRSPADSRAAKAPNHFFSDSSIFPAQPITTTNTSTPTDTLTATFTSTSTSTDTSTPTVTASTTPSPSSTLTETPTGTPTVTGTPPTLTPTYTNTPTFTPTITGTPPTPTPTGTITPNLVMSLTVVPGQASVGQVLSFRVTITNFGNAPATNIFVTDTFIQYLDLSGATSSQGTVSTNAAARTVNVTVGTLNPNQTVTIVISTVVNNFATATTIQTHNSVMIFTFAGISQSKSSNVVSFRILVGPQQGGTGGIEPDYPSSSTKNDTNSSTFIPALLVGFLLFLAGLFALGYSGRIHSSRSQWSGWYQRIGLLLLFSGVIFALGGFLLSKAGNQSTILTNLPDGMVTETAKVVNYSLTPEAAIIPWPDTLDKLPDFPIPSPTVVITPGPDGEKPDISAVTRLIIPAIGVDNIVKYVPFDGQTWMIAGLKEEIAWMGNTSWPGLGSNTGLSGHVTLRDGSDGPFRNLVDLENGDQVVIYTEEKIYTYQVNQKFIIEDSDLSVLLPSDAPRVTLITCTDWNKELKIYLKRLIVVAELVETKPIHAAQ
jgi:LPXTG-site transpeptidase (sortase) family protein